jgi:hypothetical protein
MFYYNLKWNSPFNVQDFNVNTNLFTSWNDGQVGQKGTVQQVGFQRQDLVRARFFFGSAVFSAAAMTTLIRTCYFVARLRTPHARPSVQTRRQGPGDPR